jgi:hypothetical protein
MTGTDICFLTAEENAESNALMQSSIADGSVYRQMERALEQSKNIGEAVIISVRK